MAFQTIEILHANIDKILLIRLVLLLNDNKKNVWIGTQIVSKVLACDRIKCSIWSTLVNSMLRRKSVRGHCRRVKCADAGNWRNNLMFLKCASYNWFFSFISNRFILHVWMIFFFWIGLLLLISLHHLCNFPCLIWITFFPLAQFVSWTLFPSFHFFFHTYYDIIMIYFGTKKELMVFIKKNILSC